MSFCCKSALRFVSFLFLPFFVFFVPFSRADDSSEAWQAVIDMIMSSLFPTSATNFIDSDKPRAEEHKYIKDTLIPEASRKDDKNRGREAEKFVKENYKFDDMGEDPIAKANHPWKRGNPESATMWLEDSLSMLKANPAIFHGNKVFHDCMQPELREIYCNYCNPPVLPFFIDMGCNVPFLNWGQVVDYWWPTTQVEVNNFGISAFNPILSAISGAGGVGGVFFSREMLLRELRLSATRLFYAQMLKIHLALTLGMSPLSEAAGVIDKVINNDDYYKPIGSTSYAGNSEAGGDMTTSAEAHVYQTALQFTSSLARNRGKGKVGLLYKKIKILFIKICIPISPFYYNGYVKGNPAGCFYDTLEPKSSIAKVWTENNYYRPFWKFPSCSAYMNDKGGLYKGSTPTVLAINNSLTGGVSALGFDASTILAANWIYRNSCAAYRSRKGPDREELPRMSELRADNPFEGELSLSRIANRRPFFFYGHDDRDLWANCYQDGGQLYPLVGVDFSQSASIGSILLARRAAELAGMRANCALTTTDVNKCGNKGGAYQVAFGQLTDHVNKFTRLASPDRSNAKRTEIDKIQILYPRVFRSNGEWEITGHDTGKMYSEGNKYPSKCMWMNDLDSLDHKKTPADVLLAKHKGSVRVAIWEKRRACFCPLRGTRYWPERNPGPDFYSFFGLLSWFWNLGWGCTNHPTDNMDKARGNVVAEGPTNYESPKILASLVPECYYPFNGIPSKCQLGRRDWFSFKPPLLNIEECTKPKCKALIPSVDISSMENIEDILKTPETVKPLCEIPLPSS